ncbi:hypothetical protein J1N35_007798 [Gossypium stocksii]|uniref:Reverse transcriptase domain-containing protein n=1 Tax=Gossypium stocksii TaxID=47602 RepID=A0A9D4AFW8_9ROSI|nr:hypothetical protein J1N35_007798 [Gossypium stocksii]
MAKVANRLKETLSRRIIHDNILIANELVHYLRSANNRAKKGFVIKLDMSKVYDRVKWNFIEEVMHKMGYADA